MIDFTRRFRSLKSELPRLAVERLGVRASRIGFRWWLTENVEQAATRLEMGSLQLVHPRAGFSNPLPRNVADPLQLPSDRGWWGFSFRDVPLRESEETVVATLPDCRVVSYVEDDPDHPFVGDYYPAILTGDDRSVELREIRFRPKHADAVRIHGERVRLESATWIAERVYHNHSHWLTAHLPKLLMMKQRGGLDDVVLPARQSPVLQASLRRLGFEPTDFRAIPDGAILSVGSLTVIGSDRFRPELVCSVRDEIWQRGGANPARRVFISRSRASRRKLINENEIWDVLSRHGFERVHMEELCFDDQVDLMMQTAVLVAPHGAGLTNMMFCAPGTQVVELADLSFPNPNFYALASALGHSYWLVPATAIGEGHRLARDMVSDPSALAEILPSVVEQAPSR